MQMPFQIVFSQILVNEPLRNKPKIKIYEQSEI